MLGHLHLKNKVSSSAQTGLFDYTWRFNNKSIQWMERTVCAIDFNPSLILCWKSWRGGDIELKRELAAKAGKVCDTAMLTVHKTQKKSAFYKT